MAVKKIVYLFGTGATQAVLDLQYDSIRILMKDIKDGMISTIGSNSKLKELFKDVINELTKKDSDVEHIITLYELSGTRTHQEVATGLKDLFRLEILRRLNTLGQKFQPILYAALIDMHEIKGLQEEIGGVLTLNYESILEMAIMAVKGHINYSLHMIDDHTALKIQSNSVFPILKMHGSFNWKNAFPMVLMDDNMIENPQDVLWIPPGAEKNIINIHLMSYGGERSKFSIVIFYE